MAGEAENRGKNIFAELVRTLVSVIEEKDEFIRGHSERVARAAVAFAKKLGMTKAETDKLYLAGLLHDIGMVYVPGEIISKPEKLSDEEMAMVKQHPVVAEKLLSDLTVLKGVLPLIRHHHEFVDGSGYPDGLTGDKIPLGARMLCLVDSYDALASARPQRPALARNKIREELEAHAGKQFDRKLVTAFLGLLQPKAAGADQKGAGSAEAPREEKKEPATVADFIADVVRKYKEAEIFLPVLPKVVQDVGMVLKDPQATADTLADIIEKDAAISIKLITVANSAIYRGTEKVQLVRQAIPRLGLKETQNIIYAISAKGLYKTDMPLFKAMMKKLWLHALASAYGARALSVRPSSATRALAPTSCSRSSSTTIPPEPIMAPASASASKSISSPAREAGMQPPDGPPI